jgi:hypothetical protein
MIKCHFTSFPVQEFPMNYETKSLSQGEPATVQRALPASIDDLSHVTSLLETTLVALASQLTPLLDPPSNEPVKDGCAGKVADPYQHTVQISVITARLRDVNSLGRDLMARLHV